MSASELEQDLFARVFAGDRLAFEQLLFRYHDRLLLHIGQDFPAALAGIVAREDILQQTYVAAFKAFGNKKFEARSLPQFVAWLKLIAKNKINDELRKAEKRPRPARRAAGDNTSSMMSLLQALSGGGPSPSGIAAGHEGLLALQVALAGLPDKYREAIRLYCLEENTLEETAAAMGQPPGAVRGILHRAKKKLRAAMGNTSLWFSTH